MKAVAVVAKGRVEIVEMPMPRFEEFECLVRVRASALCSSTDMKIIDDDIGERPVPFPVILGHEGVGEIVEVGARVRNLKVGDVVLNPSIRIDPGTPYTTMWANMREFAPAEDQDVMREMGLPRERFCWWRPMPVPREIPFEDAAVLLPQKEALSGVRNLGVRPGVDILIYGDGPMAQSLALFSRLEGARTIGCVGHRDERLERIGAVARLDFAVNSRRRDVREAVGDRRFDIVIDAVGSTAIVREGARCLRPGGKVGVFGVLSPKDAPLPLTALLNHTAVHMLNYPHDADAVHDEVIRMALDGRLDLKACRSHVLPMAEAARGVEMIRRREAFKVVLRVQ